MFMIHAPKVYLLADTVSLVCSRRALHFQLVSLLHILTTHIKAELQWNYRPVSLEL